MNQFENELLTDHEIITRILKGEKALFEIIVRRNNSTLYKVGRSYNYNHEDTQDLMQDAYVDAYKNLRHFEEKSSFKTWIVRIMLNNCYRKKEKAQFKNEITQEVSDNITPMFTYTNNSTQSIVQNNELKHIIERALGNIPFDYRIVFSLREINGLKVAETAKMLDITEVNVKVRLSRAKSMIRKEIEKSYAANELFEFNLIYCDAMVERVMKQINNI